MHSRKGPCAGLLNPQAHTLTPSGRGPHVVFWIQTLGTFWVQNVPFESKTKTPRFESYPGNRTKNRTSNRGAHAQECCTQCSTTCLSRRMPNAPCPYTLSILPSSKMRRALLAVGSETGDRAREQVQRVAAARTSQNHRRSVARGRISSIEMAYSGGDRSHTKGHA